MKTALIIGLALTGVAPLVIFGLKSFFKNSIRFTLSTTFVLFTLLAYSLFFIATYLSSSLLVVGVLATVIASIVILRWLFKKVVVPIESAIKTIDEFAYNELGTEVQKIDSTSELSRLTGSIETLTQWTSILLTDVQERIMQTAKKVKSARTTTSNKLSNKIKLSSTINDQIKNYDLCFYFDIEKNEHLTEQQAVKTESNTSGQFPYDRKKVMYHSFSIN